MKTSTATFSTCTSEVLGLNCLPVTSLDQAEEGLESFYPNSNAEYITSGNKRSKLDRSDTLEEGMLDDYGRLKGQGKKQRDACLRLLMEAPLAEFTSLVIGRIVRGAEIYVHKGTHQGFSRYLEEIGATALSKVLEELGVNEFTAETFANEVNQRNYSLRCENQQQDDDAALDELADVDRSRSL